MREIKFRAWHKKEFFMLEPRYIKHLDWNDETIYYVGGNYRKYELDNQENICYIWKGDIFVDENENVCDVIFDDIELMQYTGLKDKNGVEIYEGDIVTHEDFKLPSEVTFERGCFRIHGFTIANFEAIHHMDKIQVIGNIYKDSHLPDNN